METEQEETLGASASELISGAEGEVEIPRVGDDEDEGAKEKSAPATHTSKKTEAKDA